ncbi:MAG: metallophosphoesterase [Bacteroidota bacterium]
MGGLHRIVQISDLHLLKLRYEVNKGVPPGETLRSILREVSRLDPFPEAIILSGDISDAGFVDSYYLLDRIMMPLEVPYYWIPGNHDDATVMSQMEKQLSVEKDKFFQLGGRNIILLNSAIPDEMYGQLSKRDLDMLNRQLKEYSEYPSLIFVHHHPVYVMDKLEPYKLLNADDLFDILDEQPRVEAVFYGHVHVVKETIHRGVKYLSCPPAIFHYSEIDRYSRYSLPGFRLIEWEEGGELKSSVHLLAEEEINGLLRKY